MSACEQPLVYPTDPTDAPRRDFTAEIAAADSPEDQRKLLAEKQAALALRHPPREPTEPEAEPVIQDPNLRKMYERSQGERRAAGVAPCSHPRRPPASSPEARQEGSSHPRQISEVRRFGSVQAHGARARTRDASLCSRARHARDAGQGQHENGLEQQG